MFGASAFTADGKQLTKREEGGTITLPAGFHVAGDIDLAQFLKPTGGFKLGYASDIAEAQPLIDVALIDVAPSGLDFMDATKIPAAELSKYAVELRTNRGDILIKFWPEVAPNHVRNFLDLSYKKADGKGGLRPSFYDATTFHRVIPGYMIQGGDPGGTGAGDGPRMLKAELSNKHHARGVISVARGESLDSASCQFFIMHGSVSALDGQYTAFGETVSGMEAVDKIANASGAPIPGAGGTKPAEPQVIQETIVFKIVGS
jgi:cyclophilin family peptidyl-prolyl cis-trans isomerase